MRVCAGGEGRGREDTEDKAGPLSSSRGTDDAGSLSGPSTGLMVAVLPASPVMGRQMCTHASCLCLAFTLLLVHDSGVVGAFSLPAAWMNDFSVGASGLGFYGAWRFHLISFGWKPNRL